MSQERVPYAAHSGLPRTLAAFKNRPCSLLFDDPEYRPPEPEEVEVLISIMGWSQNDVAKIVGVKWDAKKGSSTVRRWKTDKQSPAYRDIPYAAWRLMLITAGVVSM